MSEFSGTAGADSIVGSIGSDVLDGLRGSDTLIGGRGNDIYLTDGNDTIIEAGGEGVDLVQSSASYTLGANLENLTLTGSDAITATGNSLDNLITGNSGNNILNGGDGSDTLAGGRGNDTYITDGHDTIIEAGGDGVDLVLASVSYKLTANVENLTLTGSDATMATGNSMDNVITGNSGNNILNGGDGSDTLAGGLGNDTYITDGHDTILEAGGEGVDLVLASASYTLAANLENLTLTGSDGITATGNSLDNIITGNSGANALFGGLGSDQLAGNGGNDTMSGGGGDDTYTTDGHDTIIEAGGEGVDLVLASASYTLTANVENLTLTGSDATTATGNSLDNVITGNSGNNILNGGDGSDTLAGGLGNDTYVTDGHDTIIEAGGEGVDLVLSSASYTLGANLENLTLTGSDATTGTGNGLDNVMTGSDGPNTLAGGLGNDTYVVGVADAVVENQNAGIDTIKSTESYTLPANVENLTLTGSHAADGTGNGLDNVMTGNDAANIFAGGLGNDIYVIGAGDKVVEYALEGTDTVRSSVTYALGSYVENLTLTGSTATNGTGNSLDNVLTGNDAANSLTGGGGNDTLTGGGGNDTMAGGAGADTFVFTLLSGVDHITDFTTGSDHLSFAKSVMKGLGAVGALGSDAFWTGTAAHDATDRVIYNASTGALSYDADGNGSGAAVRIAVLDGHPALAYTDVLIF